jgi:Xaa-Pro aminopeptidase
MSVLADGARRFALRGKERAAKEMQLRALLGDRGLDGILLSRVSSFAWATAGAPSYVATTSDTGEAQLLVTKDASYLLTNDIEAPRLIEDIGLADQGWRFETRAWIDAPDARLASLVNGLSLGADTARADAVDVSRDVARLRTTLSPEEIVRFEELGRRCAEAMAAAVKTAKPGQTELEIGAAVSAALVARDVWPSVVQVATDTRVLSYRHVLPTERRLERYALLSFCGRRDGLVCSMTRLVHFGRLPDDLRRKQEAAARVDAALLAATRPGAAARDVFAAACRAYADAGFDGEWRKHHQGGAAGYEPREWVATPTSDEIVGDRQAFAWNPSVQGTKSEDTVVLDGGALRVLTAIAGWPTIDIGACPRPAILEVT